MNSKIPMMKKTIGLFGLICAISLTSLTGQSSPMEVCDLTLQFNNKDEQELYYGFSAGDRIIFNCSENNGAILAEIEVSEYPTNVKFKDFEQSVVKDKYIDVPRTAVYRFRFKSGTRKDRLVKVHIQRIPKTDKQRNFITAVKWVERFDTVYQNNNAKVEKQLVKQTRRVIAKVDTVVSSLADKTERIHSRTNLSDASVSKVKINLPANAYDPDRSYEIISWAYWIGIGEQAESQYQKGNKLVSLAKTATSVVQKVGFLAGPYGALASLALDGVSYFTVPTAGDNVKYRVFAKEKLLDQGDGTAAFARQTVYTQGSVVFEFANDNYIDEVDVHLRVIAVALVKTYRQEEYYEQKEVPVAANFEVKVVRVPMVSN